MSDATIDSGFLRHVRACNNAHLPGERLPFLIGADQVGWVTADFARALAGEPQIEAGAACVVLADAAALARQLFQIAKRDPKLKIIPAVERELVIQALIETNDNQVHAAQLLGITRATLRKRIDKFHIQRELNVK